MAICQGCSKNVRRVTETLVNRVNFKGKYVIIDDAIKKNLCYKCKKELVNVHLGN